MIQQAMKALGTSTTLARGKPMPTHAIASLLTRPPDPDGSHPHEIDGVGCRRQAISLRPTSPGSYCQRITNAQTIVFDCGEFQDIVSHLGLYDTEGRLTAYARLERTWNDAKGGGAILIRPGDLVVAW